MSKSLPILLPKRPAIEQTLEFKYGDPVRNIKFMEGIMNKPSTFIWLGQQPLDEEQIERVYKRGIELYHAKGIEDLEIFIKQEKPEKIEIIMEERMIKNCKSWQKENPDVWKSLNVYRGGITEKVSLDEEKIKEIIDIEEICTFKG